MHPDERKIIHDLAHGDAAEEHRLEAAGCALVHCAAQFAPGTADYAQYSALEQEGVGYTKEQGELQGYVTTSFSAATYGGMARQTTGSLFQYTQGDSDADQKSSRSGMEAQRRGSIDYLTVQGGAGFGGAFSVNLHNGNVYAGGTVSASGEKGAGIVVGIIPTNVGQTNSQQADTTDSLLKGQSVGGNACAFGVCGGLNHSIGGPTAVEVGVGFGGVTRAPNPGGNANWGDSAPIFTIPGIGHGN